MIPFGAGAGAGVEPHPPSCVEGRGPSPPMPPSSFSALSVRARAEALLDPGTLEVVPAEEHDRPALLVVRGRLQGRRTLLALTDGHQRGGTVGQAEARQLSRLVTAAEDGATAVAVCWDTGGVRVQEGPAALAAASAVGVALTRLALLGVPVASLISGPRGCFGAPSVIACAGQRTAITADALWGLTGPQLLDHPSAPAPEVDARAAMVAAARVRAGHADAMVPDAAPAVRAQLGAWLAQRPHRCGAAQVLDHGLAVTGALQAQLADGALPPAAGASQPHRRRRDLFAYSFRGQWRATGPSFRVGHVHAAWGEFAGREVMAIIVGPERSHLGIGVEDAHAIVRAIQLAAASSRRAPAPIMTFVFCRGHASELAAERAGLPRALAECLRAMVAARLLGHPLLCVLGGGAYGAAYLALAAPSHRVLAIRGTTVAPMAPRVLAAFQRLRGVRHDEHVPQDLARHVPEIQIVESVVRLSRALGDELEAAEAGAAAEGRHARLFLPA